MTPQEHDDASSDSGGSNPRGFDDDFSTLSNVMSIRSQSTPIVLESLHHVVFRSHDRNGTIVSSFI
jgi:hypothetical protein